MLAWRQRGGVSMTDSDLHWLTARPIAHRGYHDGNSARYENSLPAIEAALEHGFAIECDVQPTADEDVVVFHDATLDRLTAEVGNVRERTTAELTGIRLGETDARIPTLHEMLALVDGRVPVVIEMKGPSQDGFAAAVAKASVPYRGSVALMSFDHSLVRGALGRDLPVGLTAEGTDPDAVANHAAIADEVDFLSYAVDDLPNPFVERFRTSGRPVITWTVRTPAQRATTARYAHQMTFEGFDPNSDHPRR